MNLSMNTPKFKSKKEALDSQELQNDAVHGAEEKWEMFIS